MPNCVKDHALKVSETAMVCRRSFVKIKVIESFVVYLTGIQPTSFDIFPPGLMGNSSQNLPSSKVLKDQLKTRIILSSLDNRALFLRALELCPSTRRIVHTISTNYSRVCTRPLPPAVPSILGEVFSRHQVITDFHFRKPDPSTQLSPNLLR